jgi:predicted transposase/invertase (TIGR01784 family)
MTKKPLISFDYAIKYLLKDKGDFSIVEGFISALLKTQGYKDVKIIALLEAESNQEDRKDKRSLADVIVEDEDRNKYIIEIERNLKDSFIHKSCFNTSRLIIDNLAQREDYTQIVKVIHISLLYFPIGKGSGAIYHGKTIIHEIDSKERLSVHIINPETGNQFDATEILPEYFFISVPLFNDKLEREIDEWLHVLKYDEVPEHYHSSYMSQVVEKLSILKMSEEDRTNYSYYQKKLYNDRDELLAAESRGREQGIAAEKIQIAHNLIAQNIDLQVISKATGLTISDIEKIKQAK